MKHFPTSADIIDDRRIVINDTTYEYERLHLPPTRCCLACVRLYKGEPFAGMDVIDVALLDNGRTDCTCEDFTYRRAPSGQECKHIIACRSTGLLSEESAYAADEIVLQDADVDYTTHAAYLAEQAAREEYEEWLANREREEEHWMDDVACLDDVTM